ncbi:MAG: hypothetical protein UU12_C0029G0018 [Candidatus Woesebacteria bacterium GW2011_GWA2_40_7b]|uniref:Ribbon-helix-helix protein CopG domain-containing protein n=1 Tax=Candidatus Woesebacteria bacterium GW2011_GWA2_40_7b TaxID=1618563 RepID=A0A0G0W4D5_9BACT|nr:MAG: hypothetical protein UU12_C0029G0018 [Candidatus Woesebacteria bacterium GW2011_GWA2_40_7b]
MVRTQVYLSEDQDRELRLRVALGEGTFSGLIRKSIDELIKKNTKSKKNNDWNKWKSFIGACKTDFGGKSGQELIDDYYQNDVV